MSGTLSYAEKARIEAHMRDVEARREDEARKVGCPICGAEPGHKCWWTWGGLTGNMLGELMTVGHTGRYRVAWAAGLLPELAWRFDPAREWPVVAAANRGGHPHYGDAE